MKPAQFCLLLTALLAVLLAGCAHPQRAETQHTVLIAPAPQLEAALRPLAGGCHAVLFLQRPGLAVYHVQRQGTTVGLLSLKDLGPGPSSQKSLFQTAVQHVRGEPAISTRMGGGKAVLVAGRFLVEVDAFSPSVSDSQRDAWLSSVNFLRLTAWLSMKSGLRGVTAGS